MKNFILITLMILVFGIQESKAQNYQQIKGILFSWDCKPILSQKSGAIEYYTCNYQKSGEAYIFSVSVENISRNIAQVGNKDQYIRDFLNTMEKGIPDIGATLHGKEKVANHPSIQYTAKRKVDSELTLREYSAAFIVGDNSYLVNLIGDSGNSNVKTEFQKLLQSIKSK